MVKLSEISAGLKFAMALVMAATIVVGFIIWLAQLNWYALQSTATNERQDIIQQEILSKQVAVSQNVQKSALLLSILMDEMRDLKADVSQHHLDAEKWKEKIRHLEDN